MSSSAKVSKNQRTAPGKTQHVTAGAFTIFTPCNGGKNAYVFNAKTGKNPNLVTNSPAFDEAISELVNAGHGARVRNELVVLADRFPTHGWDATLTRLEGLFGLAA